MKSFKILLLFLFLGTFLNWITTTDINAGNLLTIKNQLSSSQLSYFARMGTGVSSAQSLVKINTTANPSRSTSNLFIGDTVSIGSTNGSGDKLLTNYAVSNIGNTSDFSLTTSLSGQNNVAGQAIIASHSAIHTVTFTPVTAISAGKFQFLIKTANNFAVGITDTNGENGRDGIPDQTGFDMGANSPVGTGSSLGLGSNVDATDITCPLSGIASVGTTVTIGSNIFHNIECSYSGVNAFGVGNSYTIIIGRDLATGSQLINPAPAANHTEGATETSGSPTDIYSYYVRHLNGSTVIDSTQGKVAVIEAVRVTATVDPILTLIIDNLGQGYTANTGGTPIAVGETRCGVAVSSGQATTTGTAATFGSIGIDTFNTIAQRLSLVTNAANGYALTAFQDRYMTISTGTGVTIPPTVCNGGNCTSTVGENWTTSTRYGFGYSLENIVGGTNIMGFNYLDTGDTFRARQFGFGTNNMATVMSRNSTPSQTDRAYVCYRLTVGPAQPAGDYEGRIIYTATATF